MRTMTVAATMILLLTVYANSQDLNMLRGLDDKRPLTAEEVAKQKAADEAYKAAIGKIPAKNLPDKCVTPDHQRNSTPKLGLRGCC